jgi:hypothetical protein
MNPKPAAAPNTTANKSTVIPALRAAGTRLVEKGEARSVDQGTALEIVSRILHRRVTIADIENDRKAASGISLFAAPTELVTLFELAMRMVESHQFYSKTL